MDFLGIGVMEVLFILLIAFLLFGPRRLPEIARGLGKAVRELKKYSNALTSDLREEFDKGLNANPDVAGKSNQTAKEVPGQGTQAATVVTKSPDVNPPKAEDIQPLNNNE